MPQIKTTHLIIGIAVVIILLVGGYFLFLNKPSTKPQPDQNQSQADIILDLAPDEIGLKITATPDNNKVRFSIDKPSGIKAIAYEVTYEADPSAEEKSEGGDVRVPRAVIGDAKLDNGKSIYESPWIDLGSCSKNVCRYDKGVNSVKIVLKITKDDGKIYQTSQDLEF